VTAVDVSGSVEGCDQATVALVKLVFLKDDTIVGQEGVPIEQPMKEMNIADISCYRCTACTKVAM
jgi:hypothetical protein